MVYCMCVILIVFIYFSKFSLCLHITFNLWLSLQSTKFLQALLHFSRSVMIKHMDFAHIMTLEAREDLASIYTMHTLSVATSNHIHARLPHDQGLNYIEDNAF